MPRSRGFAFAAPTGGFAFVGLAPEVDRSDWPALVIAEPGGPFTSARTWFPPNGDT